MKYILFPLLMLINCSVFGQLYWKSSQYALVYKITEEQALTLAEASFEKEIQELQKSNDFKLSNFLGIPIDTIFFKSALNSTQISPKYQKYGLGTYIAVRASGEYLEYKFLGYYDIGIVPIVHDKKFHFHVVDTLGNLLEADNVTLDGKTVKYNKNKKRYEFRKFKNNRLLMVEQNGRKAFFEVDAHHNTNHRNSKNWFKRQWRKIRYANIWRSPWYALSNTWRRFVYDLNDQWQVKTYGYITTNKPKYLPNDTVKVKAYLTRDNKIAYNTPLTLKITQYGNYKFETTVKPTSKGSYAFEFPLGDSLQLDRTYNVAFYKGKRQLMSTSFTYEDYQLDEISYNLRADQKSFKRYEPIVFYAEGKDKNGQNVMDGDVEITATIGNIKAFHAQTVYIPDTLFHYKGALELGGEMRFPLPKATIPMADFTVKVYAVFTNSNGELHTKNLNFDIISDTAFIEMSLDGDILTVDYLENGASVSTLATLEFDLEASDFYVEKTVQLPYKGVINPIFNTITAIAKNERKNLYLKNNYYHKNSSIQPPTFNVVQTKDSVFVFGNNPSGLEVQYEVYRINRKIGTGESKAKTIVWKDKIRRKTSYRIDYEYIMNGEGRQGSQKFDRAKNQLSIEINQPNLIQPGETVDIKVKVRKNNKRNARNVNLVAGAVNTQFGNTKTWKYTAPFYGKTSKMKKNPTYNVDLKYSVGTYETFNWAAKINRRFQEDLNLDQELYYKLLFPKDGKYETQRTLKRYDHQKMPEVMPFIVKDGKFQPIYMLFVNRQFTYYYDTETRYSFKGEKGYNYLIIRGKDFELQIDSIYLEDNIQTIFSIDLNNLPKNTRLYARPDYWSESEKALLRKSIFVYQPTGKSNKVYVWQDDIVYPYDGQKGQVNFGPFIPNQPINMIRKNEFQNQFLFEASNLQQYKYQIEKNRERLYAFDAFPAKKQLKLKGIKARTDINIRQRLFLYKTIEVFDKPYVEYLIWRQIRAAFKTVKYEVGRGKIKYQINRRDSVVHTYIFVDEQTQKPQFYSGNTTYFRNLKQGSYKIYGFTRWGNYFTHDILIRKDTMIYQYLANMDFQKDEDLTLLKSLVSLKDIVLPSPTIGQNNTTKPITKPKEKLIYTGATYPVSGKITDETGEALIGCSILIKGTKIGTITDIYGNYTIRVPETIANPVLVVAYIGYATKEVATDVGVSTNYDLVLSEGTQVLDEVVVTGYGAIRKEESVSTLAIEADAVQSMPTRDIAALMGEAAGVATGKTDLKIQGVRTDESIYFIDGIAISDTTMLNNLQASSKIRSRFQDYAFWQPNLITDKNGEAIFRVTYPDDITSYQTFVLGMDRRHHFGIATKNVKSQKMALAQLAVPRFMITGDKTNIIGKSLNYSKDSLKIKSSFLLDRKTLQTNDFWLANAKIETAAIVANTNQDTLTLTYKMEHSKFFDGEKRPVPIYPKGTKETVGTFNILEGDTTLTLQFDSDKGNVKLYAQTDVLEVLLQKVQYLIDYPYGCNEQTASRLMALLMDKQIKTALGQQPPKDELIIKMVKRLEKAQNDNGSWGWWSGNSVNYWMTNYVLKALHAADTSGYKSASYETGLRFVTNSLSAIPTPELLNSIALLSDIQQNMNYEKYLIKIDSTLRHHDYYNQLRVIKIKQQQGLDYDLKILDTLEKSTLFGNIFYDINREISPYHRWYYWYSNHYNLTQMAYQVLRNETIKQSGLYDVKLAAIRGYFLEKRTLYGWRNTFTTAQILSTILPDMVSVSNRIQPKLVIKGNTTETVTEFPFETTFYANTPLKIKKTGTSTVYLTGYQQFWNETPKPKNDIFELSSKLVQEGKTVKRLTAKTPTKMVVTLEVKKEADYVMVEVPIPAGCSYGTKKRSYGYWYGREVHREYFREKTCVFYQSLPIGTYTIEINLEPRFTGEYTVNPAKAEQMYFPVFYGRNVIKKVAIDEK